MSTELNEFNPFVSSTGVIPAAETEVLLTAEGELTTGQTVSTCQKIKDGVTKAATSVKAGLIKAGHAVKSGTVTAAKGIAHRTGNLVLPYALINNTEFNSDVAGLRRDENGHFLDVNGVRCEKKDAAKISVAADRHTKSPILARVEDFIASTISEEEVAHAVVLRKADEYSESELRSLEAEIATKMFIGSRGVGKDQAKARAADYIEAAIKGELDDDALAVLEGKNADVPMAALEPRSLQIIKGIQNQTMSPVSNETLMFRSKLSFSLKGARNLIVEDARIAYNVASVVSGAIVGLAQIPVTFIGKDGAVDTVVTSVASALAAVVKPVIFAATLVTIVAAEILGVPLVGLYLIAKKVFLKIAEVVNEKILKPLGIKIKTATAKVKPAIVNRYNLAINRGILERHAKLIAQARHRLEVHASANPKKYGPIVEALTARMLMINERMAQLGMQSRFHDAFGGITVALPNDGFYYSGKEEPRFDEDHVINIARDEVPVNPKNARDFAHELITEFDSFEDGSYTADVLENHRGFIGRTVAKVSHAIDARRAEAQLEHNDRIEGGYDPLVNSEYDFEFDSV